MNRKHLQYLHHVATGLKIDLFDVLLFRRDSMRLHRWFELECGDSNQYGDWVIERDPETDKPFRISHNYRTGKTYRTAVPDMEKGARKRISERCKRLDLHFHIQTDPRGWSLYLCRTPISDTNYTNGFGIGAE